LGSRPDTVVAWPLQSRALVHDRRQSGYVPLYAVVLHCPQSAVLEKLAAHVSQRAPDHEFRHVQLQLGTRPDTAVEWLLQSVTLHSRVQFGYPL
jgi:hypothetical protein